MAGKQSHVIPMSQPEQQELKQKPAFPTSQPETTLTEEPPEKQRKGGWETNESPTLLVIATLITALTYQIGTNPPGGSWQDDANGHFAGSPIMRDKHRRRYYLFMTASLVGFGNSMLLTLWLLTGVPTKSQRIRWAFAVAYSTLVLTYIASMPGTSLVMAIAVWAGVMLFFWFMTLAEKYELKSRMDSYPVLNHIGRCLF